MTINVLFAAPAKDWDEYAPLLRAAFSDHGIDAALSLETPPEETDYIVYAPNSSLQDFTPFTRCKGVLNLWAGVEQIVQNPTLTQPLARMVDDGLTQGMVEWVCGHTLRHHLGMDTHLFGQDGIWREDTAPPLASDRTVCVLGLGALGSACANALRQFGFRMRGWSRTPKLLEGVTCFYGTTGLLDALTGADIIILLLPNTPETENTLNADTLARPARGAVVINPGRGPLIDDDALLAALESGQIGHATLDVFRTEPLPSDHPYWAHPNVTVTPHIASATRAKTAVNVIAENIRRGEAGEPLLHLVNRDSGY